MALEVYVGLIRRRPMLNFVEVDGAGYERLRVELPTSESFKFGPAKSDWGCIAAMAIFTASESGSPIHKAELIVEKTVLKGESIEIHGVASNDFSAYIAERMKQAGRIGH